MDIKIYRDNPGPPPPVSDVVLYFTPDEARLLGQLFGTLTFNYIIDFGTFSKSQASDIIAIANTIYRTFVDQGVLQ